jgi:hypothetical protein
MLVAHTDGIETERELPRALLLQPPLPAGFIDKPVGPITHAQAWTLDQLGMSFAFVRG